MARGLRGRQAAKAIFLTVQFCRAFAGQKVGESEAKELFEQGQQALAKGDYADAERDFGRMLEMGWRTAPVYVNLGVAHLRAGKVEEAIQALIQAKKLAPAMTGVDLNLGLAYYRKREFSEAAPHFAAVIAADAGNVQARYLEGMCRFMMDQFDRVVKAFEPIRDREQNDLEYLFMLGVAYGKVKRPADAERTFSELVEAGGDTPHLHLLLGKAYLALDDYQKAEPELEKAAAGDAKLPYAHYYLGMLDEKTGRLDAAATEYARETEISPDDHWSYEDLGRIKLQQDDADRAIAILEKAVARIPDAPSLLSVLAKAYLEKSEPMKAIPCLQRATQLEPNNGNYHYQLGRAYADVGQGRESGEEMAKARALQVEVLKGQMEALSRDGVH